MTETDVPLLETVAPDPERDPCDVADNVRRGRERIRSEVPIHFRHAEPQTDAVKRWVRTLVELAAQNPRPVVRTGPSLLLLGSTGTGKTHEAYGAMRVLSMSGVACRWQFSTAAEVYASLRPRYQVDSEAVFRQFAQAQVLVLDDLGAAKGSEWTEEIDYRLINYRYEHDLPTLITSNMEPRNLRLTLSERVVSRLAEMTERVVLSGSDRRRQKPGQSS